MHFIILVALVSAPKDDFRALLSGVETQPGRADLVQIARKPEPHLIALAKDEREHAFVRERAIAALGTFQTPAVEKALEGLLRDDMPSVRGAAALVLGRRFGGKFPAEVLTALRPLLKDPAVSVRKQTVRGLAQMPTKEVIVELTQRLALESNPTVREMLMSRAVMLEAASKQQASAR